MRQLESDRLVKELSSIAKRGRPRKKIAQWFLQLMEDADYVCWNIEVKWFPQGGQWGRVVNWKVTERGLRFLNEKNPNSSAKGRGESHGAEATR